MRKLFFAFPLILLLGGCASSGGPEPVAGGGSDEPRVGGIDLSKLRIPGQGSAPASGPAQATSSVASNAHYYRMKMVKIIDSQGFGQPIEAMRFLLPSDWSTKGGIQWVTNQTGCTGNIIQVNFQASSPDGLSGLESMPARSWLSATDPMMMQMLQQSAQNGTGCPVAPPMDAATYFRQAVLPRARQGAELLEIQPLTSVAEAKRKVLGPTLQTMIQSGNLRSYQIDSASAHIGYPINGQPVEEWLSMTVINMTVPAISSAGIMQGQVGMTESYTASSTEGVLGIRAPRGKFDGQLAATIIASIRPNPAYQAAVAKFQSNMNKIAMKGAMDRARIWRETNAEISGMMQDSYERQQAAQDRAAEQFSQYIRGVETYQNPSTGEAVELTGGYDNAWVSPQGDYLLSDTPGFDPSVAFGEDWTRLNRQSH